MVSVGQHRHWLDMGRSPPPPRESVVFVREESELSAALPGTRVRRVLCRA